MDWGYLKSLVGKGGCNRIGGIQPAPLCLPGGAFVNKWLQGHASPLEGLTPSNTKRKLQFARSFVVRQSIGRNPFLHFGVAGRGPTVQDNHDPRAVVLIHVRMIARFSHEGLTFDERVVIHRVVGC